MKKDNIVGFRVSLYECEDPQSFYKMIKPNNCIDSAWIPQTLGDQIWMWFEFANDIDKENYISNLKSKNIKVLAPKFPSDKKRKYFNPINWIMSDEKWLTQIEIDHWTK